MAFPLLGLGLGALLGGMKYAGDVAGNASDKQVGATTAKWSPWTGQAIPKARKANFAGSMVPSILQGMAMQQVMGGADAPLGEGQVGGFGPTAPGAPTGWGAYAGYGSEAAREISPWALSLMMSPQG